MGRGWLKKGSGVGQVVRVQKNGGGWEKFYPHKKGRDGQGFSLAEGVLRLF